jgi:hypothetical protein
LFNLLKTIEMVAAISGFISIVILFCASNVLADKLNGFPALSMPERKFQENQKPEQAA